MAVTIGERWNAANGRPVGFDLLRVGLSLSVILWHTVSICYGGPAEAKFWLGPARPWVFFIVPGFFALSGFLVAGSLERNNIFSFLTLRVLRIFPALVVEVIISAFLIGPLFTVYPLSQYFADPKLHHYFLNMVGDIHYFLPGVFLHVPAAGFVNVQLWTIPYELECYLAISVLGILGLAKWPRLLLLAITLILMRQMYLMYRADVWPVVNGMVPGKLAVFSFLFGAAFYLLRNKIVCSWPLFVLSVALFAGLSYSKYTMFLTAIPLVYATVFVGVQNFKLPYIATAANYSYGLYLYGCPVQQAISDLFPHYRVWYFNFILGTAVTLVFAAMSWIFLESKVMERRKPILRRVNRAYDAATSFLASRGRKVLGIEPLGKASPPES